jgi:hypothetical protein
MVPRPVTQDPGYQAFIRKLNSEPVDASLLHLISSVTHRSPSLKAIDGADLTSIDS